MPIYYIQFEAIPLPEPSDYKSVGGAYINCWIDAPVMDDAKKIAECSIAEIMWKI